LTALIDRLAGQRVLVLGDLMLDEYLWGEAARLSAEAPVPVVAAYGGRIVFLPLVPGISTSELARRVGKASMAEHPDRCWTPR